MKIASCCPRGSRILIGVSGGADSVALTSLLLDHAARRNWTIGLAHIHHGIRGAEADQDEEFVRGLAKQFDVPVHVWRVLVPALERPTGVSIEMAAREARRTALGALMMLHGYNVLALAHTLDDQAETVLMRMIRGTTPSGLSAMGRDEVVDGLHIIRPLLDQPKEKLRALLEKRGLSWREDGSNQDTAHVRNRVRHELMPILKRDFNPSILKTLARLADTCRAEDEVMEQLARRDYVGCVLDLRVLSARRLNRLALARRRRVVRHWISAQGGIAPEDIDFDVIDRICHLASKAAGSQRVMVRGGVEVVRQYDYLSVIVSAAPTGELKSLPRVKLVRPGESAPASWGLKVTLARCTGYNKLPATRCGHMPAEAFFSADEIGAAALYIRPWQPGDRFAPLGSAGEKKVQDIFVDLKVPKAERTTIPLVECRRKIIWIPGYTIARHVAVETASSPSWHIRLEKAN